MSEKSTPTRTIPIGRNAVDIANISQSVGGTWYGTTPGGTRIIYDRNTLLNYKSSPISKTPPTNLPSIPGVTNNEHQKAKRSQNQQQQQQQLHAHPSPHQQHPHPHPHHQHPNQQQQQQQATATVTAPSNNTHTTAADNHGKDDAEEGMFEMDD